MNRDSAIDEIKSRFLYMSLPFQKEYYTSVLQRALRKYTINSGKTRTLYHSGADSVVDLSAETYVRVVTNVLPSVINVSSGGSEDFNPWFNNILVTGSGGSGYAGGNFYIRNMEDILIRTTWSKQISSLTGGSFDWLWNPDSKILSVNRIPLSKYDGFLIQFLPDWDKYWKHLEDSTEDFNDSTVLDWVIDYSEALIRKDIGRVIKSGSMYDLPEDGGDMLDEAKEDIEDLEAMARSDSPLLGMSE